MRKIFLAIALLLCTTLFSQQVPFSVEIEPVICGPMPGMHSFAFAQSGSKWLFVGGRTNGLHGFSTNNNFDVVYASDVITVIDTSTWSYYTSPLGQLPKAVADPLRATNAQYTRIGDYLYITGGFGWDSTASAYRTFPVLTAIHVDNMITAVMTGSSIAPHIRQITDNNLRVCGGEMQTLNGETSLFFGHNFYGRYSDPPQPTFTQLYTNEIKRFTINDDGVNLSISNYSAVSDTNNFRRRDLNLGPVVLPDGSFGVCAYSGVFQKNVNWPWPWPINYDPVNGAVVDSSFSQRMNNYTCALAPLYDSVQRTMYTVLFGGMSQYNYNPVSGQLVFDSLVPFVGDISVLVHDAAGQWAQVPLALQMPDSLQGSNMKFIPVSSAPMYANDVIRLRELSGRVLAGYLVGGIVSSAANQPPMTWANDTVYRVWITPDQNLLAVAQPEAEGTVDVFPNPTRDHVTVRMHSDESSRVMLIDASGRVVRDEQVNGRDDVNWETASLAPGMYMVQVIAGKTVLRKKLSVL